MTIEEAIKRLEIIATNLCGQSAQNPNLWPDYKAVDMAISALRQQDVTDKDAGKWISVKDRLPDYMGEVLVIVSGKPHENITLDGAYEIAEYDPVEGWILEMWPEWCSGVVTHWMPLPEPPEEGTV